MSSFKPWQLLCSIIHVYPYLSLSQEVSHTAHLQPSSIATQSGISVSTSSSVTAINDKWSINVATQQGSDINISMSSVWGFHPIYPSSIELYIQGNTSNETYMNDGEILFVFSVEDQYFAEMVSIDKRKTAYKECPDSNTNLLSRNVYEMIEGSTPDRFHRFCNNSVDTPRNEGIDYWNNVGGNPVYRLPAQWPMFISVTNDPITKTVTYAWTDFVDGGPIKAYSLYNQAFNGGQGVNIFISGDNPNEDFWIHSIDITYQYTVVTSGPTNGPITTQYPTKNPTVHTTDIPTLNPALNPTPNPALNPTLIPTLNPALTPPLNAPLILTPNPTLNPALNPTLNAAPKPTELITNIITSNSTTEYNTPIIATEIDDIVTVVIDGKKDSSVSWFQAVLIVLSILVFFLGWIAFFGFVHFTKRKTQTRKGPGAISVIQSEINIINEKVCDVGVVHYENEGSDSQKTDKDSLYESESALIMDAENEENISVHMREGSGDHNSENSSRSSSLMCHGRITSNLPSVNAILNNDIHNPMDSSFLASETESETSEDTSENESFVPGYSVHGRHNYQNITVNLNSLHIQHSLRQQQLMKHNKSMSRISLPSLKGHSQKKPKASSIESAHSVDI